MPDLEQSVRDLFTDDASRTDPEGELRVLAPVVGRRADPRRARWSRPLVAAAAVAVLAGGTTYVTRTLDDPGPSRPAGPPSSAPAPTAPVVPSHPAGEPWRDPLPAHTTPVTSAGQIVGSWSPVRLFGQQVDLTAYGDDNTLWFGRPPRSGGRPSSSAGDGTNSLFGTYRLGADGAFRASLTGSTAVACLNLVGTMADLGSGTATQLPCVYLRNPDAVDKAVRLVLDDATGRLLLIDGMDRVLGSYERIAS